MAFVFGAPGVARYTRTSVRRRDTTDQPPSPSPSTTRASTPPISSVAVDPQVSSPPPSGPEEDSALTPQEIRSRIETRVRAEGVALDDLMNPAKVRNVRT